MSTLASLNPDAAELARLAVMSLAEAKTVPAVKAVRDRAEALRHYLGQQRGGADAARAMAELRIRAERKLGEMLAEMEVAKLNQHTGGMLREYNIEKTQSHRWQMIAALTEEEFEGLIAAAKKADAELTSKMFYLAGKRRKHGDAPKPQAGLSWKDAVIDRLDDALERGELPLLPPEDESYRKLLLVLFPEEMAEPAEPGERFRSPPQSEGRVREMAERVARGESACRRDEGGDDGRGFTVRPSAGGRYYEVGDWEE